jgi:NhaP-type Na+/H+ or K+/H+ antiporter
VLGLVVGFLFGELMQRTEDPLINIALTSILAYGVYFFAHETLHELVSPVVAVVVAGIRTRRWHEWTPSSGVSARWRRSSGC